MPDNNNQSKVTTLASVRAGAAHLMELIASTIQAAVAWVIGKAGVVYVETTDNVQTILDFFNTHDLTIGQDTYRYIGEVEPSEAPAAGFVYQFGLITDEDGHVSTEDVVYGDRRDYDNLSEGDTVYIDAQTTATVTAVALPTHGFVNLEGFDDPLQVTSGTNYMN